jgi:hypothetical protein
VGRLSPADNTVITYDSETSAGLERRSTSRLASDSGSPARPIEQDLIPGVAPSSAARSAIVAVAEYACGAQFDTFTNEGVEMPIDTIVKWRIPERQALASL